MLQIIYRETNNMPYHVLDDSTYTTEELLLEHGRVFKTNNVNSEVLLVDTENFKIIKKF